MSTTRANWFLDELTATDEPGPTIPEVGESFDLRDPGTLAAKLAGLVEREGQLYTLGITCQIKDLPDTTCSACPMARTADSSDRLALLCSVGRQQEKAQTEWRIARLHAESSGSPGTT